ncbi:MAG TPA: 50S ribosomal protein L21 [Anaerolineales bacterium]|nr:50S ribosomal protein L21 [Anaerolineales bacterium]
MKYAIIESGGKQYVAREGETLEVDRLPSSSGQAIEFDHVLLAADGDVVVVGAPHVTGASVHATVQSEVRGPKILVFRYTPKKRFRKRMGHRSVMTRLMVDSVTVPGGGKTRAAEAEETPAPAARRPAAAKKARAGKAKAARPAPKPAAKPAAKKPPAKTGKK